MRTRKPRKPVQLDLDLTPRTWGGKRAGAGRKRVEGRRSSVPHRQRPVHKDTHPVHVTMRAGVGGLRGQLVFEPVREVIGRASSESFRVIHFSVQSDHLHLLVEADDKRDLSRGLRSLAIRLALRINRVLRRRGRVFVDRYHARALTRPRSVRNAFVYILMNHRKHRASLAWLDRCSSARSFDGWRPDVLLDVARAGPAHSLDPPTVVPPLTWLARTGWRRLGLVGVDESPALPS
jgi:REP element-mobilizing transposase RayT